MVRRVKNKPLQADKLRPPLRDLFGEIPISVREMRLWLWKVPVWFSIQSHPRRGTAYLRDYRVAEKIARAKAESTLESIFGDESCPHCGQTLENDLQARIDALTDEISALRATLNRPRAPVIPLRYHAASNARGNNHAARDHLCPIPDPLRLRYDATKPITAVPG